MQIKPKYLAALLLSAAIPLVSLAQTSDATLVGIISDASGASAAGATISAVNNATGVAREVVTNDTGAYRLGPLVPGTYTITAKLNGFKTKVQKDVVLQTGAVVKIDVALEVGNVTESVEVTGAAPMLQTQEASVGGVISQSQLARIPVNGRN